MMEFRLATRYLLVCGVTALGVFSVQSGAQQTVTPNDNASTSRDGSAPPSNSANTGLSAGDLQELAYARAYITQRNFAEATRLLKPLADKGITDAQILLSGIYLNGIGVRADYAYAFNLALAAAPYDIKARAILGHMYLRGLGVSRSCPDGLKNLREAAEQNHAGALGSLAVAYASGTCVATDFSQAASYATKGVQFRSGTAAAVLGDLYERGLGFEKDLQKALDWHKKAVEFGSPTSSRSVDRVQTALNAELAEKERLATEAKTAARRKDLLESNERKRGDVVRLKSELARLQAEGVK